MQILVIDDGPDICNLLRDYLTPEGFQVETVHDGIAGLERSLSGDHEFVILDVKLPGMDGFEILRKIRESSNIPILMLTICDEDTDRIKGLQLGADDYLNKPFNLLELLARINTILRRCENQNYTPKNLDTLAIVDLSLELGSRRVYRNDEEISLTAAEFTLLEVFLSNAGQVVPREELVHRVQGRHNNPYDRSSQSIRGYFPQHESSRQATDDRHGRAGLPKMVEENRRCLPEQGADQTGRVISSKLTFNRTV